MMWYNPVTQDADMPRRTPEVANLVANPSLLPNRRKIAQEIGSSLYFTGKPCKRDHLAPRHTSSGQCLKCLDDRYDAIVGERASVTRAKFLSSAEPPTKVTVGAEYVWLSDGSRVLASEVRAGDVVGVLNGWSIELGLAERIATIETMTTKITTSARSSTLPSTANILCNGRMMPAWKVQSGDLVGVPRQLSFFGFQPMPEHELDLLAVWLAEGRCYGISTGSAEIIRICSQATAGFGPDMEFIQDSEFGWRVVSKFGKKGGWAAPSNKFRTFLESMSLWDRDSKTKFIPDRIFRLPKHQLSRFLNLFWACDGCITKAQKAWSVQVGLANELMITQLSDLLLKFGVHGNYRHKVHAAKSVKGHHFESWTWCTSHPESLVTFADEIGAVDKNDKALLAKKAALQSRGNCNEYIPISYDEFLQTAIYEPINRTRTAHNTVVPDDMPISLKSELNSWRKQTPSRMSMKRLKKMRSHVADELARRAEGDVYWEEVKEVVVGDVCRMRVPVSTAGPVIRSNFFVSVY
jgi:hypothetical protein